jgi:spore coat polysaccharide biosynthesis predicted glycosyltransferase SpsG
LGTISILGHEEFMMDILIVCRGTVLDGLGHLLRVRTFAQASQKQHSVEIAAILDKGLETIFSDIACKCHLFNANNQFAIFFQKIQHKYDVIIFDLLSISSDIIIDAKKKAKLLVSLSPIFNQMCEMDMLFTRFTDTSYACAKPKIFSGLEYTILGNQCLKITDSIYEYNLSKESFPIAICMGGTDAANKTLKILQNIITLDSPLTIWVLLGEGYSYSYDTLIHTAKQSTIHEIILAKTNKSMWSVMANCCLAILAGGLTTMEAIYAGLPSINVFEVKQYSDSMKELFDSGVTIYGGSIDNGDLPQILKKLNSIINKKEVLREFRIKCQNTMIDKCGSERIISILKNEIEFL